MHKYAIGRPYRRWTVRFAGTDRPDTPTDAPTNTPTDARELRAGRLTLVDLID
jgi:hypothetical protein